MEEKGAFNNAYHVLNTEGETIGHVNLFQKPEEGVYKYNVKMLAFGESHDPENYKWFKSKVRTTGPQKSVSYKLRKAALFLVNEGLL